MNYKRNRARQRWRQRWRQVKNFTDRLSTKIFRPVRTPGCGWTALALMFLVVSGATRVEAARTYDLNPDQIEAAVEEHFASLGSVQTLQVSTINATAPSRFGKPWVL